MNIFKKKVSISFELSYLIIFLQSNHFNIGKEGEENCRAKFKDSASHAGPNVLSEGQLDLAVFTVGISASREGSNGFRKDNWTSLLSL